MHLPGEFFSSAARTDLQLGSQLLAVCGMCRHSQEPMRANPPAMTTIVVCGSNSDLPAGSAARRARSADLGSHTRGLHRTASDASLQHSCNTSQQTAVSAPPEPYALRAAPRPSRFASGPQHCDGTGTSLDCADTSERRPPLAGVSLNATSNPQHRQSSHFIKRESRPATRSRYITLR